MTSDEFTKEIRDFGDLYGVEFPERQTKAWFLKLRSFPIGEFREILGRIQTNLTSLPFAWSLVGEVGKAAILVPAGKAASFETPRRQPDDQDWAKGAQKARELRDRFANKTTLPGVEVTEEKRREALRKLDEANREGGKAA